ncbi:MAG: alpha-1,2-fucosyltransferase [Bacteroidota bacterium]|nr:alpha-1,2-fucosyltransferase [Bacteroidota bacterium]
MAKVFVKIPKTGLGNMLMVWAHALVFARMNGLEIVCSSWWGFRWGALVRGEKRRRLYRNYFKETDFVKRNLYQVKLLLGEVIKDPAIYQLSKEEKESGKIFLFQKTIRESDLFKLLRDHQALIREELYQLLNSNIRQELSKYEAPVIGVHIRRGDFKIGNQATPLSYFINTINLVRKNAMKDLPVTVFSDAHISELTDILGLPQVKMAEDKADILDILIMSKSRILILSKDSTFSYWAAFLSDALVIMKHDDWQSAIRQPGENYREIKWNDNQVESQRKVEKLISSFRFY